MNGKRCSAVSSLPILCWPWWDLVLLDALGEALGISTAAALLFAGMVPLRCCVGSGERMLITGGQIRAATSDLLYSFTLLIGWSGYSVPEPATSLAPRGADVQRHSQPVAVRPRTSGPAVRALSPRDIPRYREVWRRRLELVAHRRGDNRGDGQRPCLYRDLFLGPTAFAPLSASALLIRPIGVVMNALTDFERPQMARSSTAVAWTALLHSLRGPLCVGDDLGRYCHRRGCAELWQSPPDISGTILR